MKQRKYNVTLAGRPWSGAEAQERYAALPLKLALIDGRLYFTQDDRLEMLAALLEHCGAAAAVRMGDPAVWHEAVRGIGSDQTQPVAAAEAPVMGRDVLAGMPFSDDPNLGEISPAPLPNPNLPSFLHARRTLSPEDADDSTD